jgi:mono/diheme cytochrome c family protein
VRLITFAIAGLLTAVAARAVETQVRGRSSWTAPASADARRNPLPNEPPIVLGGEKVFHQRCATCHGKAGTGTSRGPNLTTDRVQGQSDGALFWKISSGNTRSGMPGFSFLPEGQRWQLILQLRAASGR